jgi:hypothetical protein
MSTLLSSHNALSELASSKLPPPLEVEASQFAGLSIVPLRTWYFGDASDGIIESICQLKDGGVIEIGYYFGASKPKGILKVSSQVGCVAACAFCDVGSERFQRNVSTQELLDQIAFMQAIAEGIDPHFGRALKISFAGTGEPLLNPRVPAVLNALQAQQYSYKLSTVFPKGEVVLERFMQVATFAGAYTQALQLQISIISTDEGYRRETAGIRVASLTEISEACASWRACNPPRKQVNLSLILSDDTPVCAADVLSLFPPEHFRFRFRPYVPTQNGGQNGLRGISNERYQGICDEFARYGYYVGHDAIPTPSEQKYSLASNVSRRVVMSELDINFPRKIPKK